MRRWRAGTGLALWLLACLPCLPAPAQAALQRPRHSLSRQAPHEPDERLIGWLGETFEPGSQPLSAPSNGDAPGMRVLSWQPRIFHYRRFLTDEECDHLIAAATPRLRASGVSDSLTGEHKHSDVRTSHGMFFTRDEDATISRIEDRVAAWTMLPKENAEAMQILRYEDGQEYRPHSDYFSFPGRDKNGGNRMATVLMYLTEVEEGGETVFPRVPRQDHQTRGAGWSNCSLQGLAVRPRKGDALLFWSIQPDGRFDHKTLHGSCPVTRGTKFCATKWLHVARFGAAPGEAQAEVHRVIHAPPPPPPPAWCRDRHKECEVWAESGECEVNPGFMVSPRGCPRSCGRCDVVPAPPQQRLRE